MDPDAVERKLAAILSADAVGYSRLMAEDEAATIHTLTDYREAIAMLVAQLEKGRAEVENQYVRSVTRQGNRPAQKLMQEVFEVCDRNWRGIGPIPRSGLRLRPALAEHDAEQVFDLEDVQAQEPAECISAEVLQGMKAPTDCPAFGGRCTPQNPLGALMVSSEGACAAYHRYRRAAAPHAGG